MHMLSLIQHARLNESCVPLIHGLTVPRQDLTTPAQPRPEVAETSLFHIRLQLIKDLHHNNQMHTDYAWYVATTTPYNQDTVFDFGESSLSPIDMDWIDRQVHDSGPKMTLRLAIRSL